MEACPDSFASGSLTRAEEYIKTNKQTNKQTKTPRGAGKGRISSLYSKIGNIVQEREFLPCILKLGYSPRKQIKYANK